MFYAFCNVQDNRSYFAIWMVAQFRGMTAARVYHVTQHVALLEAMMNTYLLLIVHR